MEYKLTANDKKYYNSLVKSLSDLAKSALVAMESGNNLLLAEINYEMNRKYEAINQYNLKTITWIRKGVKTNHCK